MSLTLIATDASTKLSDWNGRISDVDDNCTISSSVGSDNEVQVRHAMLEPVPMVTIASMIVVLRAILVDGGAIMVFHDGESEHVGDWEAPGEDSLFSPKKQVWIFFVRIGKLIISSPNQ